MPARVSSSSSLGTSFNAHAPPFNGRTAQLTKRQPCYIDDIIWRVVTKLTNEIISKNKTALTFNVLGAAANQTTSAVYEVAHSVSHAVTDVLISHNPKVAPSLPLSASLSLLPTKQIAPYDAPKPTCASFHSLDPSPLPALSPSLTPGRS